MSRAAASIRLDHDGIAEVLKSEGIAQQVHAIAERKAETVRAHRSVRENGVAGSVRVEDYTTDRAASAVVIAHAAGLPIQAKYGVLTKGGDA